MTLAIRYVDINYMSIGDWKLAIAYWVVAIGYRYIYMAMIIDYMDSDEKW
jgi:hypothetical protein